MENKESVVVITGASRGIGYAIAEYFLSKKNKVILIARNKERLEEAAETLSKKYTTNVEKHCLDVASYGDVKKAIEIIIQSHYKIDIMINSAGIVRLGTSNISSHDFNDLIKTNLIGIYNFCSAASQLMKDKKAGRIINIASIAGKEGFSEIGGYSASKFGVIGYSQALAKELLPYGIQVNTLCPDVVATDMSSGYGLEKTKMIQTEDIVKTIEYILGLSSTAIVDEIQIKCRAVLENNCYRKVGS